MFSCVEHGKSFITSGPELFLWEPIKGSNPSVLMNPPNPRVILFFFHSLCYTIVYSPVRGDNLRPAFHELFF